MIKSLEEIDYETDREEGIDTIFSRQENNKLKGDDVLNGERGDDKIDGDKYNYEFKGGDYKDKVTDGLIANIFIYCYLD